MTERKRVSQDHLTKKDCRQYAVRTFDRIINDGRFGLDQTAPLGTLRGIDVMPCSLIRQKLSRAAIVYVGARQRLPDFENPTTFYEKLVLSKLFAPIPMPSPANKLGLAPFSQIENECFAGSFPVLWSGNAPIDSHLLDTLNLPAGRYYAKSNAGSGTNFGFDLPMSKKTRDHLQHLSALWLDAEHGVKAGEWWYGLIRKQNFIEADMSDSSVSLTDWKFHVGAGRTLAVQVDVERSTNHRQLMYDRDFNFINEMMFFKTGKPQAKPDFFDDMRHIAEAIAARFQYARVDLYHTKGKIYLGEITLAPIGGMRVPKSEKLDNIIGGMWRSPFFQ